MRKHLAGDWEFRCVHARDTDHLYDIEQKMREADAIIVSAPVYNLQPTGRLIRLFNKLHGTGDYRRLVREGEVIYPKLGACITVGGTNWTNFGTTYAAMATSEFAGNFENMVDQMNVQYAAAPGSVLLNEEALKKARWAKWGIENHNQRISAEHKRYADNAEFIKERNERYLNYKAPITLPRQDGKTSKQSCARSHTIL